MGRELSSKPWGGYYNLILRPEYDDVIPLLTERLRLGSQKTTPEGKPVRELVRDHSRAVMGFAHLVSGFSSPEKLGSTQAAVTVAAGLHDESKMREIAFDDSSRDDQELVIDYLVHDHWAREADLRRVQQSPHQALQVYEARVHHLSGYEILTNPFSRAILARHGDPETILDISDSCGLPVNDLPMREDGHRFPPETRLAREIIFVGDLLHQGTELVSLDDRYEAAKKRYDPEGIEMLYQYGRFCGDEIAREFGLKSYQELPEFGIIQAHVAIQKAEHYRHLDLLGAIAEATINYDAE